MWSFFEKSRAFVWLNLIIFFLIFQLFLPKCVLCTLKTLLADLGNFFGVSCDTFIFALKGNFWGTNSAPKIEGSHDTPKNFPRSAKRVFRVQGTHLGRNNWKIKKRLSGFVTRRLYFFQKRTTFWSKFPSWGIWRSSVLFRLTLSEDVYAPWFLVSLCRHPCCCLHFLHSFAFKSQHLRQVMRPIQSLFITN